MPNLLPEKNKKEILREFLSRFSVFFLIFSFVTFCIFIVALTPSYILSNVNKSSVQDNISVSRGFLKLRKQDSLDGILKQESEKLKSLKTSSESFKVTKLLKEVIEDKPKNVKIDGFFYEKENTPDGKQQLSLVVRGTAKDRNTLVNFINDLEGESDFSKVDFPVSNLLKGESANFSVKIFIK